MRQVFEQALDERHGGGALQIARERCRRRRRRRCRRRCRRHTRRARVLLLHVAASDLLVVRHPLRRRIEYDTRAQQRSRTCRSQSYSWNMRCTFIAPTLRRPPSVASSGLSLAPAASVVDAVVAVAGTPSCTLVLHTMRNHACACAHMLCLPRVVERCARLRVERRRRLEHGVDLVENLAARLVAAVLYHIQHLHMLTRSHAAEKQNKTYHVRQQKRCHTGRRLEHAASRTAAHVSTQNARIEATDNTH
jgi:hypothetical protein